MCDCTKMHWMREDPFHLDSPWMKCGAHDKLDMHLFFGEGGGGHGAVIFIEGLKMVKSL